MEKGKKTDCEVNCHTVTWNFKIWKSTLIIFVYDFAFEFELINSKFKRLKY